MKIKRLCGLVLIVIILGWAPFILRAADDNPFEQAAQDAYTGRFRSSDVELRLAPEAGKWKGSLVFKGKTYTADGEAKAGRLEGQFSDGSQAWSFTAQTEADKIIFTAGEFIATLTRQSLPKFQGTWGSRKVEIDFQTSGERPAGLIRYGGREFTFSAEQKAGDLEGVFKNGEKSYPFTVVNEPRGIVFQTGTFAELIKRMPQRDRARNSSLGMIFVPVPGTSAHFSIWDVRVQDYEVFAKATSREWKRPDFAQGPTHPAVNVSWDDAKAFCAWLTQKERSNGTLKPGENYRLPTDAEWSIAVGLEGETGSSPQDKDAKIKGVYPWGTVWPPPKETGNYGPRLNADDFANTSPVGSYAENLFGLYDMGGNVWQWCEDWYDGEQKSRVLRGASWLNLDPGLLLSSYRLNGSLGYRGDDIGFRVVLEGVSSR